MIKLNRMKINFMLKIKFNFLQIFKEVFIPMIHVLFVYNLTNLTPILSVLAQQIKVTRNVINRCLSGKNGTQNRYISS